MPLRLAIPLTCALLAVGRGAPGQLALLRDDDFRWGFERGGVEQDLAALGGLNSPQPSLADVDGDGEDELYLFDRDGDVHLVLRRGGGDWVYAPELADGWPAVESFARLRDFDGDGVPDLFAYSSVPGQSGLEVYRGVRQNGRLGFGPVAFPGAPANVLHTEDGDLIYVAISDVPAVEDVDGDGDLDVLSVDAAGSYVRYYENVGPGGDDPADHLRFRLGSRCYGGAFEGAFDGTILLADEPGTCAEPSEFVGPRGGASHPGSTLGLTDLDGDGDLDLLVGDVAASAIVALTNEPGPGGETHFTALDPAWPAGRDAPAVAVDFFPAAFALPGERDATDVLVSPSNPSGGADYEALWRYESAGGGPPELRQRDFLTRRALDHGSGAHVALGDLTGDGVDDVLVGNDLTYNGGDPVASLAFYAYDAATDVYREREPTWLRDLNAFVASSVKLPTPLLVDLDDDGDLDLLLGNDSGSVAYAENVGGAGRAASFSTVVGQWQGIDVGSFSAPAVGDVSGDGLPDLLVGDRAGRLSYFPNVGSTSAPRFDAEPAVENYGGIDVRLPGFPTPNLRPALVEVEGRLVLYVGTAEGRLVVYDQLPTDPRDSARLARELSLGIGGDLDPAFGYDPAGEPLAIVGNARGGIGFYRVEGSVSTRGLAVGAGRSWRLAPNPTAGAFAVEGLSDDEPLRIASLLGRTVYRGRAGAAPRVLPRGSYVVRAAGSAAILLLVE